MTLQPISRVDMSLRSLTFSEEIKTKTDLPTVSFPLSVESEAHREAAPSRLWPVNFDRSRRNQKL